VPVLSAALSQDWARQGPGLTRLQLRDEAGIDPIGALAEIVRDQPPVRAPRLTDRRKRCASARRCAHDCSSIAARRTWR